VLAAARERAVREGTSVGAVVSDLARAALTGRAGPTHAHADTFHGFEPFPSRGPAVTNRLVDQLREDEPE
jgi:hypothetical protein